MLVKNKSQIYSYITILLFLLIQYGLLNIKNLGLVTDDWSIVKPISNNVDMSFTNVLNFKLDTVNPGYKLARPLNLLVSPLHVILFQDNILSHHLAKLVILAICMVLLYEVLVKITKQRKPSLIVTILFITMPFHTSFYYWLATRISVYAFIASLLSILCLFSKKPFVTYVVGPLLFLLSISGYEIFIAFLPYFFYVLLSLNPLKRPIKLNLFTLFLYSMSAGVLFAYRKYFISFFLGYRLPKSVDYTGFSLSLNKFYTMLSGVFGKGMFDFLKSGVFNITLIRNLDYWYVVVIVLLTASLYFAFSSSSYFRDDFKTLKKTQKFLIESGLILLTSGLVVLLPTQYSYSLGSQGDRVNIVATLGMSLLMCGFLYSIPKKVSKYLLFITTVIFTLINLEFLGLYIKSYDYQKMFIKKVNSMDIPENSIVYIDTDLKYINNIPVLTTEWGLSAILSYASGREKVEYVGDWKKFNAKDRLLYTSSQYRDYVYINPSVIFIKFNKKDTGL